MPGCGVCSGLPQDPGGGVPGLDFSGLTPAWDDPGWRGLKTSGRRFLPLPGSSGNRTPGAPGERQGHRGNCLVCLGGPVPSRQARLGGPWDCGALPYREKAQAPRAWASPQVGLRRPLQSAASAISGPGATPAQAAGMTEYGGQGFFHPAIGPHHGAGRQGRAGDPPPPLAPFTVEPPAFLGRFALMGGAFLMNLGVHQIGPRQMAPDRLNIPDMDPPGQRLTLDHGRRQHLPEMGPAGHDRGRRHHIGPLVNIYIPYVIIDGHLFDAGHPGHVGNGRPPVVIAPPGPDVSHRVVTRRIVVVHNDGAPEIVGRHRRRHQTVAAPIGIRRRIGLGKSHQKIGRLDENPEGRGDEVFHRPGVRASAV
jgi:hypothetical protein